jgi:RHS repeat-associated protein
VGTPTELVASDGHLAWQSRTTLWGTSVPGPEDTSTDCPLRFPGQYADPETGLHYNYFRYYDPETARYVSPDPMGLEPSDNHHAYVPNPSEWVDVLGLALCRTAPRIEDGNHKEGWQHIDERHIAGNGPSGHGDLLPPTTTRQQVLAAAEKMVAKGTRVSDPNKRMQTFEMRMKVNGFTARNKLIVDSWDGNRVITFFPEGRSYR